MREGEYRRRTERKEENSGDGNNERENLMGETKK